MNTKKKILSFCLLLILCCFFSGCSFGGDEKGKIKDLEFTIVSEDRLSEELKKIMDEKKAAPFNLTFHDQEFLYICIGYGEQETGGYSIAVNELYLTKDSVCVDTNLLGPSAENKDNPTPSYPYIVIKTEYVDKPVIFE